MVASISQSSLRNNYALRVLTEIATRLKVDSGQSQTIPNILSGVQYNPLQDAASKIAQIVLESQSRVSGPVVLVDPTPPEERTSGLRVVGADAVMISRDVNGNNSITTLSSKGSVTTATGPIADSQLDIIVLHRLPTVVTLVSDVDVGLVKGSSGDEFIAVASKGNISNIFAGDGSDTIVIAGGARTAAGTPIVQAVDGGNGDDHMIVVADRADRISGGEGNDSILVEIESYGPATRIDGGAGDDDIHVRSVGIASDVSGGEGNDQIRVEAGTVRNVSGGDGDDDIHVGGPNIEGISGGRGDDRISIWNPQGNVATLAFNEGDGHDVVETYGPLKIMRFNADGSAQQLDLSSLSITKGEKGQYIVDFGNGTDSVTIYIKSAGSKFALQATSDGGILLS